MKIKFHFTDIEMHEMSFLTVITCYILFQALFFQYSRTDDGLNLVVQRDDGNNKEDKKIESKLQEKEKEIRNANKVKVPSKHSSKTSDWLDSWSHCKCGKGIPGKPKHGRKRPRILKVASGYGPNSRKWMVYMLITDPETNKSTVCAGSIINKLYIVTAAHCFCKNGLCEKVHATQTRRKPKYQIKKSIENISGQVKLLIGETHASSQRANHRNVFKVEHIKIHPDYRKLYNDISLIKVKPPMDFSKPLPHNGNHILPICLPPANHREGKHSNTHIQFPIKLDGQNVTVAGWGSSHDTKCTTDTNSPSPNERCVFPFKEKSMGGGSHTKSVTYNSCTYASNPSTKNPICSEFYRQVHTLHPFPKFPIILEAEKETVVCQNNTHGKFGWCRTSRTEFLNRKEDIENWGWCRSHCRKTGVMVQSRNHKRTSSNSPGHNKNSRNRNSHSGRTFITGSTKTHLQETMLMVLTKKECEDLGAYKSKNSNKTIKVKSDVELCAASVSTKRSPERWIKVHSNSGEDAGKKFTYEKAKEYDHSVLKTSFYGAGDSCRGDSGAPLWLWTKQSSRKSQNYNEINGLTKAHSHNNLESHRIAFLVGLVSRGKGCGLKNRPGIYTRVESYLDWIKKEARAGNCEEP